jgi:hypothetical protein
MQAVRPIDAGALRALPTLFHSNVDVAYTKVNLMLDVTT